MQNILAIYNPMGYYIIKRERITHKTKLQEMDMTKAYYIQKAQNISPIYGVSSIDEANRFVPAEDHHRIVSTSDDIYMDVSTGSVDFESNWESEGNSMENLVRVEFDADTECWKERKEL
jgi:hypothetical protein